MQWQASKALAVSGVYAESGAAVAVMCDCSDYVCAVAAVLLECIPCKSGAGSCGV